MGTEQEARLRKALARHKAALTRARKSKNADNVLRVARAALRDFEELGWPDCWAVFEGAVRDAEFAISRRGVHMPGYTGLR